MIDQKWNTAPTVALISTLYTYEKLKRIFLKKLDMFNFSDKNSSYEIQICNVMIEIFIY